MDDIDITILLVRLTCLRKSCLKLCGRINANIFLIRITKYISDFESNDNSYLITELIIEKEH